MKLHAHVENGKMSCLLLCMEKFSETKKLWNFYTFITLLFTCSSSRYINPQLSSFFIMTLKAFLLSFTYCTLFSFAVFSYTISFILSCTSSFAALSRQLRFLHYPFLPRTRTLPDIIKQRSMKICYSLRNMEKFERMARKELQYIVQRFLRENGFLGLHWVSENGMIFS